MRLPDIRALLDRHLAGRPTRANFRTGTLTVCTMVPMRSVPHRVVCLVGLDDGVFPRLGVVDGDDVLARDPMTGERDIRSEDRQLLLDAIGAATEKLVITYTGANEYSGQERPPAVPLAELLDTLDRPRPRTRCATRIVVKHPLQPFDTRNVIPGKLIPNEPFTFRPDRPECGARPLGDRAERPPFISGPLPAPPPDDVVLADLVAFFRDPVKGFFRALDYTLPWEVDGVEDAMPVDINALEEWTVGDRMLHDMLRGMDRDQARDAEWRRGTLPPGQLGWRKATEIRDQAALLADAARAYRSAEPDAVDVDIDLGAGRRLTGTVSPVFGDRLVVGDVFQARRPTPAAVVDSVAGVARSRSGPRLVRGLHRPRQAGHHAAAGDAGPPRGVRGRPAGRSGRDVRRGPARTAAAADRRRPYAWAEAVHAPRRSGTGGAVPVARPATYPGEDQDAARTSGRGARARG